MTVIVYDGFDKPGRYTLADYEAKWSPQTLGEMAVEDTRQFDNQTFSLSATPFRTSADSGVGLYRDGVAALYVNRGLGFTGQKIRLFTPREIACIELVAG